MRKLSVKVVETVSRKLYIPVFCNSFTTMKCALHMRTEKNWCTPKKSKKGGVNMQFRRVCAVVGSALLAGATLATAAMGATVNTVGEITKKLGTPQENFPLFVVGADAAASDVAAAIDIAVRLAANYKKQEPVEITTAETTVTGGKLLQTDTKKLYYGSTLNTPIQVLTSNDLPKLLASGTIEDENGQKYNYDQYLRIGNKTITFGDPVTTDTTKEAEYYIQLGTNPTPDSDYLVQAEVVFDNPVPINETFGKKITLFGQEFTIAPESTTTKLVLYKSSDKVTVGAGETKSITVGGKEYTVKVVGIVDSTTAVVEINGITKEVEEGKSYDFGGLQVYIEDVFYYKVPTETGSVVLSAGADKYIFENGQPVKEGNNEDIIKGTRVAMGYNDYKLTYLKIAFDAADTQSNYIKEGDTWTDPVFGTIKVAFNGLDSSPTEKIVVEPASSQTYRVSFTDKNGNSVTLEWAYDSDLATTGNVKLADSNGYAYHLVEGEATKLNEYTFLAAAEGFERIVQVTSIDATPGAGTGKLTLRDVVTGAEFDVNLKETNTGIFTGTKVIDGQEYYVYLDTKNDNDVTNDEVKITWGKGSDYGDAGNEITVYPILRTSKGAEIVLTKPETLTFSTGETKTISLPTGDITVTTSTDGNVTVSVGGSQILSTAGSDVTVTGVKIGSVAYDITAHPDATAPTVKIALNASATEPALMIIEEEDANGNKNAVIIPVKEVANTNLDLDTPVFTGMHSKFTSTGDNEDKAVDVYGTMVYRTNTNEQDTVTITYPDKQLVAAVAVGSNPKFGEAKSEVMRDVVIPVTTDVAKLDTEIGDYEKQNYDLIVVGGPCVNKIAAELLGDASVYKSHPACDDLFASVAGEKAAIVKVFPNVFAQGKTAVLVAGWNRDATKKAAMMLQSGELDSYNVPAVKITDSTVEELTVEAPQQTNTTATENATAE